MVQGVYRITQNKGNLHTIFRPVKTGVTGATDIEVTRASSRADEIVIGPLQVLRRLTAARRKRDNAPSRRQ